MSLTDRTNYPLEANILIQQVVGSYEATTRLGRSAIPTILPTTALDLASTVTVLLENGFTHRDLGIRTLGTAAEYLDQSLRLPLNVAGIAHHVESDAADHARAVSALCVLGQLVSPVGLIAHVETRKQSYANDQKHCFNFTTTCFLLKALLDLSPGNHEQMNQIGIMVTWLCEYWWTTSGPIRDQTNTSANYSIMLMVDSFTQLLTLWEKGHVPMPHGVEIREKVMISLFQALTCILQTQNDDGSWESGGCETTAYAIISLSKLKSVSSAPKMRLQVTQAIEHGRKFVLEESHSSKSNSESSVVCRAFVLAALHVPVQIERTVTSVESHFKVPLTRLAIQTKYYAQQPWFVNIPEWLVQACLIETYLVLPRISKIRYAVFPSSSLGDDRYFESIPFACIAANRLQYRAVGAECICQMTMHTVLSRQLEDYMENVVGKTFAGCLFEVEDTVYEIFEGFESNASEQHCHKNDADDTVRSSTANALSNLRSVMYRFISHYLQHPNVLAASLNNQAHLRSELLAFLLGCTSQLSETWATKVSSDQTSHAWTFAFLACMVARQRPAGAVESRHDFLDTPEQQYLAADMCRHMSIMSFISSNADQQRVTLFQPRPESMQVRDEHFDRHHVRHHPTRSISSVSTSSSYYADALSPVSPISSVSSAMSDVSFENRFPEPINYHAGPHPAFSSRDKLQMDRLIKHERRCLNLCFEDLIEAGIDQQIANEIKFLVDFNDLAEQIYHDPKIGSTCQVSSNSEENNQACSPKPPPVPPKRNRGSVATARAALNLTNVPSRLSPCEVTPTHVPVENNDVIEDPEQIGRAVSTDPIERNWSWNTKPTVPNRSQSRASSEISRIESIMSEIDGFDFDPEPKPIHHSQRQSSENLNITRMRSKSNNLTFKNPINTSPSPSTNQFLPKTSPKLQQRIIFQTQCTPPRLPQIMSTTEEPSMTAPKRRATCPVESSGWIKSPPPDCLQNMESRASKLRRASRLGGPKWKAPF